MPCDNGTVDPTLAAEEHSDRSQVASSTMFELVIGLEVSDEFVFAMEAIPEHAAKVKSVMAVMARRLAGVLMRRVTSLLCLKYFTQPA
jgi:hypothetical protein